MSRIVYLDDVIHEISKQYSAHNELVPKWLDLSHIPKAEEKQTNTAEWDIKNNGGTTMWYECSACENAGDKWDKFCKHCGCKMTNAVAE